MRIGRGTNLWLLAAVVVSAWPPAGLCGESKMAIEVPSAEKILDSLREGHPRLMARAEDFERIKTLAATNALLKEWWTEVERDADGILEQKPSEYVIPDGLRLLATSRRVLDRVATLGMMYRLTGERRYADRAWRELEAAAAFQDWNPRHFLDTAEMTHAFGLGYDWLYDAWTDQQRAVLRRAMVEKGLEPGLACHENRGASNWWPKCSHNWNQVCNGGLAVGALAIADEEPELAARLVHEAARGMQLPMAEFDPDGAWGEGPGYWHYAVRYNVYFLAALETALGTDFGLSVMPGFSKTGDFPIYMATPSDRTFNFADVGGRHRAIRAPQMFWLARKFDRPDYAAYQRAHAAPDAFDLLWYRLEAVERTAPALPLDKHFRHADVAVLRSAWDDPKAVYVGFKAGSNHVNHSHLDLGSFVLEAGGTRWAEDLGSDDYNLPEYFGALRWTYYRLRAESHNTLVINPGEGPDQDPRAAAKITRFETDAEHAVVAADLTAAYAPHARKVARSIELRRPDTVEIVDEIELKEPGEIWWFMHTAAEVRLEPNGRTAALLREGARLSASLRDPPGARFQVMPAAPLPSSPKPERQADDADVRTLAIRLDDARGATIRVKLVSGGAP